MGLAVRRPGHRVAQLLRLERPRQGVRGRKVPLDLVMRLKSIYAVFPRMTSSHYVFPRTRDEDGFGGRESYGSSNLKGRMVELSARTMTLLGNKHVSWEEVRTQVRREIRHEDVEREVRRAVGGDVRYPPEVLGTWLLRDRVPSPSDDLSIKTFDE